MQGKILDYSTQKSSGIIAGADGKRYTFTNTEWKVDYAPANGNIVDFEAKGAEATNIYVSLQAPQARTSGLAIACLVLSIFWLYWIGSILAVIFGHIARSQIKKSNGTINGSGIALAGLIIGYIGIAFIVLIVGMAAIASSSNY